MVKDCRCHYLMQTRVRNSCAEANFLTFFATQKQHLRSQLCQNYVNCGLSWWAESPHSFPSLALFIKDSTSSFWMWNSSWGVGDPSEIAVDKGKGELGIWGQWSIRANRRFHCPMVSVMVNYVPGHSSSPNHCWLITWFNQLPFQLLTPLQNECGYVLLLPLNHSHPTPLSDLPIHVCHACGALTHVM